MVHWNFNLSQEAFFHSELVHSKNVKLTSLGSCIEMLHLTNLLNFFGCVALFDAKILSLLLRNNELAWEKSIKLISCYNDEWLVLNSFFKTSFLQSDLWLLLSLIHIWDIHYAIWVYIFLLFHTVAITSSTETITLLINYSVKSWLLSIWLLRNKQDFYGITNQVAHTKLLVILSV